MDNIIRTTRLEIDLDIIKYNMKELLAHSRGAKILAVVKADAYSNGAIHVAKTLMDAGAHALAVATINEALQLRASSADYPIMILGFTDDSYLEYVAKYDLIQTVYNEKQALTLNEMGKKYNKKVKIHLKINTGMNRLGFKPSLENLDLIKSLSRLEHLNIEGIFSHFSESEIEDKSFTHEQYEIFSNYLDKLKNIDLDFEIKHISNWAAACDLPEYNMDMVRLGVPLFGIYSNYDLQKNQIDLELSMCLKTKISNLQMLKKGESISYNRTYFCDRDMKIATIPIGYADGLSQELAQALDFYINDQAVKSVGKVCMDQMMLDVSSLDDLDMEDEVIVFDNRNQRHLAARNISNISKRVPKIYIENGQIIKVIDELLK